MLGDPEYTYELVGRRATDNGSLAHINLPPSLSGASYNADNQLTQWGTTAMSYDLDGNLLNDGAHAYTWNVRNQLAAIDSGSTASFVYGPFGRRVSKTVYGVNTGYLYDGANVVQELAGSNPSANLLTGGLDEVFTRTDSNGVADFIRDGLGSTAALTDSTGAISQTYTYDPYGATSTSGGSTNSYQYIGREADATGLYFLRARYYNPSTGRFLSEDPMGFAGSGTNLYAYTYDDPIDYRDPSGKWIAGAVIGGINGAAFGALGAMTGDDWDWQDVVAGATIGGVLGAGVGALDPTEGALASPIAGAAGDFAGQAFHKWRHGQNMSWGCYNRGEIAGAGLGGALGGGLGLGLEGLGAAAGFVEGAEGYNALLYAESLLGSNVGLVSGALGGAADNAMFGRKSGCQ